MLHGVIPEDTRYWHVLASFDTTSSMRISPLLPDLDSTTRYSALKSLWLTTLVLSGDQQACLCITELGDLLPTKVMDDVLWLHASEPTFYLSSASSTCCPTCQAHFCCFFGPKIHVSWLRRLLADTQYCTPQDAFLQEVSGTPFHSTA